MEAILQKETLLTAAQTTADGVCRPDAVMALLQDAAVEHAEILGVGRAPILARHNCVWMLVRSWYRLSRPLRAGECIKVQTWAYPTDRLTSEREFALFCGEEPVGSAMQVWALVDVEQRKLVRMQNFPEIQAMAVRQAPVPVKLRRLPLPELQPAGVCVVQPEDIDVNGHMNNVAYLHYVMLPLGQGFVRELQINYDRECRAGETLRLQTGAADGWRYVLGVNQAGQTSFEARVRMDGGTCETCKLGV